MTADLKSASPKFLIDEGRSLSSMDSPYLTDLLHALADALERAEKERDEAKSEARHYVGRYRDLVDSDCLRAENEQLQGRVTTLEERLRHEAAESEALRDALILIARNAVEGGWSPLGDIARKALTDHVTVTVRADGDILREQP